MDRTETIVAISTPPGQGGVGLVRLSGPLAMSIGRTIFYSTPPLGERIRRVEWGRVIVKGREIDTGLAWAFKGPRSYTGEDTVEISCHGSMQILDCLIQTAISLGAVLAAPGEFTRRAFLNGHLDLLQAEAVIELIQAGSQSSLETAYGHASGRLSQLVKELKNKVIKAISLIEISLDFSEDHTEEIDKEQINVLIQQTRSLGSRLIDTFDNSRHRQNGYLITLVGRPNVGKSTLFNSLLGEDRAIVTPIPGTTRDLIESQTLWEGEIIRLVDTAGLRSSTDIVEKEGIDRAQKIASQADFLIAVFDSASPWQNEDRLVFDLLQKHPGVIVYNKTDLFSRLSIPESLLTGHSCVQVSALTGKGIESLQKCILEKLPRPNLVDGMCITRQRHRDCLVRVVDHLGCAMGMLADCHLDECIVAELRTALDVLGQMLGEDVDTAVLDRIFSEFCIGK